MTDWDRCYLEGETPWNKGAPSPPLVEWVTAARPHGRALMPGFGVGHDLAMLVAAGVDATGVDISPTAVEMAQAAYPDLSARFVLGDLFALPEDSRGSYDLVFEHTCLCAMPPELRTPYEKAVADALRPGGLLVGVWFINPDLDPGETGPPFPLPVEELDTLFPAQRWEILEDYVPAVSFPGREGRERLRVLRRK